MYSAIRRLLFLLEPEKAHSLSVNLMRIAGSLTPVGWLLRTWFKVPEKPVKAFGLNFRNPIGLAAGYDKDGLAWRGLACLGFGHIELGTVTPRPQDGNPHPRLFRLPEEKGLINRMGFPGRGASFVIKQLCMPRPSGLVLGVNLGINRDTVLESAASDYIDLMQIFAPLVDFLVINVSSPNTVGLRRLQAREALEDLLSKLKSEHENHKKQLNRQVPLLIKLAPDLSDEELDDALDVITRKEMDGVIATNTTVRRVGVQSPLAGEIGGLSGAPLRDLSTEMIRKIHSRTSGALTIIGVGGIMDAVDVREKMEAGATLVQVYTGLVYKGPGLVAQILREL
jgi:dihydroorotate dehydrogenase